MIVYIVRHGESENNARKVWTGWMDVALTKKGRADARLARKYLKKVSFDKVYSSDLKRAVETAKVALPRCRYETSALLREINVGDLAGKPLPEIDEEKRAIIKKSGYETFNGESQESFNARVAEFKKILENDKANAVAVFCHAGWLKNFLYSVLGAKVNGSQILCDNCTIGVFEYKDSKWKLLNWISPNTLL